jgi:sialidase-1
VSIALWAAWGAAALGLAGLAAAGASDMSRTTLWKAGESGYETYRIPGIVVTPRGTILAYAAARRRIADGDWSDTDIVMRRSEDGGVVWQPSRRIAGAGRGVTANPVALPDRQTGAVHFLYQTGYDHCFYMRSVDDGRSFSKPVDITGVLEGFRPRYAWTVIAPSVGHAIQLRSGRLLAPIWMARGKETSPGRREHAPSAVATIYSDDHGDTWRRGAIVAENSPALPNPSETMAVELADGRVMVNMRTTSARHRRAVSISPDGISRWSPPRFDEALFDPICAASVVRYTSAPRDAKNRLLFSNPDSEPLPDSAKSGYRLRRRLTLRLSEDDGETWPVERVIEPGSAGYSDLAVGPNGAISCIYEAALKPGSRASSVVFRGVPGFAR